MPESCDKAASEGPLDHCREIMILDNDNLVTGEPLLTSAHIPLYDDNNETLKERIEVSMPMLSFVSKLFENEPFDYVLTLEMFETLPEKLYINNSHLFKRLYK